MSFINGRGLIWYENDSEKIALADNLLSSIIRYEITNTKPNTAFCASDSCMIYGSTNGIYYYCFENSANHLEILSAQDLKQIGVQQLQGIAYAKKSYLNILDNLTATLYKIFIQKAQ